MAPSGALLPCCTAGASIPSFSKACSLLFPLPAQLRPQQENANKLGQWVLGWSRNQGKVEKKKKKKEKARR